MTLTRSLKQSKAKQGLVAVLGLIPHTNCLTDLADELDGNQSDFFLLPDPIAYADDLVNAEPQLVFILFPKKFRYFPFTL